MVTKQNMRKRFFFIGLLFAVVTAAFGQNNFGNKKKELGNNGVENIKKSGLKGGKLLDDSTKQIYGPTTTRYTFENNIKYNQPRYYTIDTLLDNIHRFNYVNKHKNQIQDLGNIGTAATPIFFQPPNTIGVRSGIHIYDLYFRSPDQIKYYDSHSPYSNLDIVIGGGGRTVTSVNYSRNINPLWNIGFDYKGLFIDEQVERVARGDRNVLSTAYDLYTHYQTGNRKYQLLAHLSRNMHKVDEFGGIMVEEESDLSQYFAQNIRKTLQEAKTQELRTNIHIYQQYEFSNLIQAYHQIDRSKQESTFKDDLAIDGIHYDTTFLDSDNTFDRTDFHTTTFEQGVKGDVGRLFYNFYYKRRDFDMDYRNVEEDTIHLSTNGFEQYGGVKVRFQMDSLTSIVGDLEYLIGSNYQISGLFQSSKYTFSFRRMQYDPSFIEQFYYGNHDKWNNDFSATSIDEFKSSLKVSLGQTSIKPFGRWGVIQ